MQQNITEVVERDWIVDAVGARRAACDIEEEEEEEEAVSYTHLTLPTIYSV